MKKVKNSKEAGKELTLAFGSLILGIRKKITAVKRRVHLWKRYRELRQVKGSAGEISGRWSRSLAPTGGYSPQAAMGAPITAPGYKEDRKIPVPAEVFAVRQR